eukprot:1853937-Pyramimonas_sp.AAC.1
MRAPSNPETAKLEPFDRNPLPGREFNRLLRFRKRRGAWGGYPRAASFPVSYFPFFHRFIVPFAAHAEQLFLYFLFCAAASYRPTHILGSRRLPK